MTLNIQVEGILADAGNARGGYPVQLVSNIADAVSMRLGNTFEESLSTDWKTYKTNSILNIYTG
jgi:hypothetical protein